VPLSPRIFSVWRNLVHRDRVERDLDDEVRAAFELLVDEKVRAGMRPEDARRAATLELGYVESIKEQVRDTRAGALVETFLCDVRYGVRLLFRSPAFSVFAVASLALGIGATAAIFALFDSIVLRKLPVPEPDRLVVGSFGRPGTNFNHNLPYPQFEQIRQRNTTLDGVFAMSRMGRVSVALRGEPEIAEGLFVSGDYYETLRLKPTVGRLLGPGDDRAGQAVAVISHPYWQRRFGGRTDIVGDAITLNRVPFTIVGVEPQGFAGIEVGRPYDISVPMRALEMLREGNAPWNGAFTTWIYVTGRLKPGVSLEQAEAETKEIFRQTSVDGARSPAEVRLATEHIFRLEFGTTGTASGLRAGYERWLRLLLMLLGAVLLLASLNVATLLLSRSDARRGEITTRLALGAGRWRIVRQFLTESLVLAAAAGALGLAIASWGSRVLLRVAVPAAERLPVDITPDLRIVSFTAAVSLLTCVLFGLIPAIRATSPSVLLTTRQVGGGRQRRLVDRALVASQVALSLVLLVTAGLFLRTLGNIWALDTGYGRHNVLMFSVDAGLAGKRGPDGPNTYLQLLDELRSVPGARSVTASAVRPVDDSIYLVSSVRQVGDRRFGDDQRIRVAFNNVAPGYFSTVGIPLIMGRDFDERDSLAAPKVVIVSERMARHFDGNPVGQRIGSGPDAPEVIGVVKDIRYANVKDAPREVLYFPMFQAQSVPYPPTFEIRYTGVPSEIVQSIRAAVSRTDPGLTMFRVKTLEAQTRDSLARERLLAMLTSYIGGFAVLLACIGLFGLVSYGVTRRTGEIGLRMAMGAQPTTVRWLVIRDAAATVLAGALVGLVGSFAAVRLVETQLFGVRPHDPIAVVSATIVLLAAAFVAAYLPARRASRIDPVTALRHE
jgi:predicted permease